jgi:4-amino-4-deoxy-L-arabinose transferase-like glycosyltransferase
VPGPAPRWSPYWRSRRSCSGCRPVARRSGIRTRRATCCSPATSWTAAAGSSPTCAASRTSTSLSSSSGRVAVASLPGGEVTERTAALPAVVSSVATVAAVFAIGARTWSLGAGAIAALVLTSTIGFFAIGHHGQSDVMVTAWTWWALYALLAARRAGYPMLRLAAFYACIAGAIMSKGPMGLLGLAAGFAAVAFVDGWRDMARLRPVFGLVVVACS